MENRKSRILGLALVYGLAIFFCLGLLALSIWSSRASSRLIQGSRSPEDANRKHNELKSINQTRAFKVLSLQRNGQDFELSLRNDYDKNITAFAISPVNPRYLVRTDLIDSDEIIVPGATHTKRLTLPDSETTDATITVRSVVFQDGTSDGDIEVTREILDSRLGEKTQMQRIVALLDNTLKSPAAELPTAFDSLKARIRALPTDSEEGVSVQFKGGLHSEKEKAIWRLEQLELSHEPDANDDLRQQLTEMKINRERRVANRRDLR